MLLSAVSFAQELLTAEGFFNMVAEAYADINDYIADVSIRHDEEISQGLISYKSPSSIRIDFSRPEEQMLLSDGRNLWFYIPNFNMVLQQTLRNNRVASIGLVNSEGLRLLKSHYSIAYLQDPTPTALDLDGEELVTQLRLNWRTTSEGFRQLILSIDHNFLIRRIVGITVDYEEVQFDFLNIRINEGIPSTRFEYDAPASANLYTDFLFEQ